MSFPRRLLNEFELLPLLLLLVPLLLSLSRLRFQPPRFPRSLLPSLSFLQLSRRLSALREASRAACSAAILSAAALSAAALSAAAFAAASRAAFSAASRAAASRAAFSATCLASLRSRQLLLLLLLLLLLFLLPIREPMTIRSMLMNGT